MEVRNLLTRFGADSSGFKKGAAEVKSELTNLNKSFFDNKKAMTEVNKEIKALEKSQKDLKKAMENGGTKEQKAEYDKLTKTIDGLSLKKAQLKTDEQELKTKISATTKELTEQSSAATKNKISLEDVGNGLKKLATGYLGVTTAVFAFGAKMGKNADDLNTLSKITGLTTEELQKFQYASEIIDVSMDTLTGSMSKMIKNMATAQKGTGDAAEAFKTLKVAITDANGLRDKDAVFAETINALAKVANETERDALAMQIFGKSAQDLNPLILGGADALKQLGDEAEKSGMILSQDKLDKLNAFNDKLDTFKAKLAQTAMTAGVEVVDAFDDLFNSTDDVVEVIKDLAVGTSKVIGFTVRHKEAILALVVAYGTFKTSMSIGTMITGVAGAINALSAANKSATASQLAMNTAAKANPYVLLASVILSVATAIGTYAFANKKAKGEVDKYAEAMEQAKQQGEEIARNGDIEIADIRLKARAYEELRNKINPTIAEKEALKKAAEDLQSVLPEGTEIINQQTGAYRDMSAAIDVVLQKQKAQILLDSKKPQFNEAVLQEKQLTDELSKTQEEFTARLQEFGLSAEEAQKQLGKVMEGSYDDRLRDLTKAFEDMGLSTKDANQRAAASFETVGGRLQDVQNRYNSNKAILEDWYKESVAVAQIGTNPFDNMALSLDRLTTSVVGFGNAASGMQASGVVNAILGGVYMAELQYQKSTKPTPAPKSPQVADGFANAMGYNDYLLEMDAISKRTYYNKLAAILKQYHGAGKEEYRQYYVKLHNMEKDFADEKTKALQEAAEKKEKALQTALENQRKKYELAGEAEKKVIQDKIDLIDKEIAAHNKLTETLKEQKEIDYVNAQLKYSNGSQLDSFSRMELERKRESLVSAQSEAAYQSSMQAKKEKYQNAMNYASTIFSNLASGTTSNQSIVNNNSRQANINIVNQALSSAQIAKKVKDEILGGLI